MGFNNKKIDESVISEMISLYLTGEYTAKEISCQVNCSKSCVLKYLKKNGIVRREPKKRRDYSINDDFFAKAESWDEKQAYLFGFILGDGYVDIKHHNVKITLSIKDEGHLLMLNSLVQDSQPKREKKNGVYSLASLRFFSKKICQDLQKLGLTSNKTVDASLPLLPKEIMPHVIRGLIDADGCFSLVDKKHLRFSFSGNKKLCEELLSFLQKELAFSNGKVFKDKRSEISHEIHVSGKETMNKLYKYLYADATVFLERKKMVCDQAFSTHFFKLMI